MLDAQRSSGVHHIITLLLCCCVDASMHQCVGASVCCCGLVRNGRRKSRNGRAGSIVNISNCSSLVFIMSWARRRVSVSAFRFVSASCCCCIDASVRRRVSVSARRRHVVVLLSRRCINDAWAHCRCIITALLCRCCIASLHIVAALRWGREADQRGGRGEGTGRRRRGKEWESGRGEEKGLPLPGLRPIVTGY